jgi:hypothetical protein
VSSMVETIVFGVQSGGDTLYLVNWTIEVAMG